MQFQFLGEQPMRRRRPPSNPIQVALQSPVRFPAGANLTLFGETGTESADWRGQRIVMQRCRIPAAMAGTE